MAVSTNQDVEDVGVYVPFRGVDRQAGPVGTLMIPSVATGDATGGAVTITVRMKRLEFGFHPIFVPTRAHFTVNEAAAQEVLMSYSAAGNERISSAFAEEVTSRITGSGDNIGNLTLLEIPIEPSEDLAAAIMQCRFTLNTDTDTYNFNVFGVMYDAEAMAKGKRQGARIDMLMAGVR